MTINGKQISILTEMVAFHFKVLPVLPPVTRVHKNGSQYSLGFEDGICRIELYILMQTSTVSHLEFATRHWFKKKRIKTRIIGNRNTVSA